MQSFPKKTRLVPARVTLGVFAFALLATSLLPRSVFAGDWEFSLGFFYNKSTYSESSYSWTRRWGASVGYYFFARSQIEFAFQDSFTRTYVEGYENTQFRDRVYSLNWVQSFADKNATFQPYVKGGVGQLNRDADGTYAGGARPTQRVDSVTGVLGAGFRFYILKNLALRTEATSYLEGGAISKWSDNFSLTIGASVYF